MNINLTLIGQAIAFTIFVYFCMKYVWPPLTDALAERKKKIADGLDAADKAQRDLESAKAQAEDSMRECKTEVAAILEQANKRASQIIQEAQEQAGEEKQRILAAAEAEIEQNANRAKEELRAQVATLAVAGAEKILGEKIDMKAHSKLVDKLVAEL